MKQDIKSNLILTIVILVIMIMMSNIINYAMGLMENNTVETIEEDTQEDLFTYMFVMASYNTATGGELSYDDFENSTDRSGYENAFAMYNAGLDEGEEELSAAGFEDVIAAVNETEIDPEVFVRQFEYVYALAGAKGVFTGEELDMQDMMDTMFSAMGISSSDIEKLTDMDMTVMINKIYFTAIGLLPIFLLVVIVANGLIAGQVDKGSMAYILSTPTKRSAVAVTQAVYMILIPLIILTIVCIARNLSSIVFFGETDVKKNIMLYLGMYLVTEAIAGICYFASCFFNESKKALAFGGGITVWFFLASLLGMFGSSELVDMGIGVDVLNIFNKLTIISLFDINAIGTVSSAAVDWSFVPKLAILAVIAVVFYIAGAVKFNKKDLPL